MPCVLFSGHSGNGLAGRQCPQITPWVPTPAYLLQVSQLVLHVASACDRVVVSPLHCFKRVLLREHVSHFSGNAVVVLCAVGPDTSESGTPPRKRTVARGVKRAPSAEQEPPQEAPDLDAGGLP
jgi:hypothetical protein